MTLESGDRELCLVLVAGLASVKTQHADFPNLGKRMSPFERTRRGRSTSRRRIKSR
nr:KduI/IolB family [Klebsiella pneumoniae]